MTAGHAEEPKKIIQRIGVVVPVYGHARLVVEAIQSACGQETDRSVSIIAVDDGCPNPETPRTLAACRSRYPGRFISVRQRNQGLSTARNTGVRVLLEADPETDAVFFLDADNRLEPHALEAYARALEADDRAGWAFPDITAFGLTFHVTGVDVRETAVADAPLRHLRGNISEAGSLVKADLFRDGIAFDETMRSGLEDWDFWLSARAKGFHGVRVKDAGFLYRVRPESMVSQSRRETHEILSGMQRKHKSLFAPRNLYAREHREAPRFLHAELDQGTLSLTSDPALEGRRINWYQARASYLSHVRDVHEVDFPGYVLATAGLSELLAKPFLRSLVFEALSDPITGPVLLKVEASDHASRFFDDTRHARRVAETATGFLAIIPVDELYRLTTENAVRPILSVLRDVTRLEHWTLPVERLTQSKAVGRRRLNRLAAVLRLATRSARAPVLRHASRSYRGPTPRDVRALVVDDLCSVARMLPYPFVSQQRDRCLLSVETGSLASKATRDALRSLASDLHTAGLRISLLVGGQTTEPWVSQAIGLTEPENVILQARPSLQAPTFGYQGTDLPVHDPSTYDRLMTLSLAHDVVVSFGITQVTPFLGEMKGRGLLTLTACPDVELIRLRQESASAMTALAAYEHAHHSIAVDAQGRAALTSRGVPAVRLVAMHHIPFAVRSRLSLHD
ncbi:MAG TPA: glycosyltransferase family A protein [Microvirga sp.]|jgi:glycosyltransferase involved in cell wall biosynthesis|nr:glycosyltransferase family A protein [Microvirga sp.]